MIFLSALLSTLLQPHKRILFSVTQLSCTFYCVVGLKNSFMASHILYKSNHITTNQVVYIIMNREKLSPQRWFINIYVCVCVCVYIHMCAYICTRKKNHRGFIQRQKQNQKQIHIALVPTSNSEGSRSLSSDLIK